MFGGVVTVEDFNLLLETFLLKICLKRASVDASRLVRLQGVM